MIAGKTFRRTGFANSMIVNLSREVNVDGTVLVQADVASISRTVWDRGVSPFAATPTTPVVAAEARVVASTFYDTLQTGDDWGDEDASGYNFRDEVASTMFADGKHRYLIKYAITLAAGGVYVAKFYYDTDEEAGVW